MVPGAWHTTPLGGRSRGEDSVAVLFPKATSDQNQKWVPAYQRRTVETYLRLTQAELARHPGEKPLIVWPETALPFNFDNNGILVRTGAQSGPPGPEPPADRRARLPV